MNVKRTFLELETKAIKWWPKNLEKMAAESSVLPTLLATQEQFISILKLSGHSPTQVFEVLKASGMPANLFLKHLVILSDYGGELIKRLGREFKDVFKIDENTNKRLMRFSFKSNPASYEFKVLPVNGLGNVKLGIDGAAISKPQELSPLFEDMIMILLHGGTSDVASLACLEKCEIGSLLGDDQLIDKYVKEKYLFVSRITTGASANTLGQIAQTYVLEKLRENLPKDYNLIRNGKIVLSGYNKEDGMPFDIVVENGGKKIGVEVSFQVTTNSVIERKAGQAKNRYLLMHQNGFLIAYVIDGAGNFQRSSAVSTICEFSDCTVAYSENEISHLANFIQGEFNGKVC